MATTLSGYYNTTQILTPTNPSVTISGTIKADGTLGGKPFVFSNGFGAVYGPQTADFTITNLGLIDDTNTTLTNAANAGIALGATGTVLNQGTILSAGGEGLYLYRGGAVINSGTIIGEQQGIFIGVSTVANAQNLIINTGLVDALTKDFKLPGGTNTYIGEGIAAFGSADIQNGAKGTVEAQFGVGIELYALDLNYLTATETIASGSLENAGKIKAAYGVGFYALGTFSNTGKVLATKIGAQIFAAEAVMNTGTITGTDAGIIAYSATNIVNSHLIEATGTKLAILPNLTILPTGIDLSFGGTINNSSKGSIIGGGLGIELGNSSATGMAVLNSGLIAADSGIFTGLAGTYSAIGINLLDGGLVSDSVTGTISGSEEGINFIANSLHAAGTVINAGIILATGGTIDQPGAISMQDGGTITNKATGTISGFNGIYLTGGATSISGFIDNLGDITGTADIGVLLEQSSSLTNSGHITGHDYGLLMAGSNLLTNRAGGTITSSGIGLAAANSSNLAATILNAGVILAASSADGVLLAEGGTFNNAASGTLSGAIGFLGETNTTLINAGTITGQEGVAVLLYGTDDKVIVDPGAVFNGMIFDETETGILRLAAGSQVGTFSVLTAPITGFSMLDIDAGARWDFAGTIATLLNNGTLAISNASSLVVTASVSTGSTGLFLLAGKAYLEVASMLGTNSKIEFLAASPSGTLAIDTAADFGKNVTKPTYAGPLLEDFKHGDVIDLKNIAASGLKLNYNATTGDLQISNSSGGIVASLQFQNSSLGSGTFQTAADLVHGTLITLS